MSASEIISYDYISRTLFFDPITIDIRKYKVIPFVEIDPKPLIFYLNVDMTDQIEFVETFHDVTDDIKTLKNVSKDMDNHWFKHKISIENFLFELENGDFLTGFWFNEYCLIVIFGSDESWLVYEKSMNIFSDIGESDLVKFSKENMKMLRSYDEFAHFLA